MLLIKYRIYRLVFFADFCYFKGLVGWVVTKTISNLKGCRKFNSSTRGYDHLLRYEKNLSISFMSFFLRLEVNVFLFSSHPVVLKCFIYLYHIFIRLEILYPFSLSTH